MRRIHFRLASAFLVLLFVNGLTSSALAVTFTPTQDELDNLHVSPAVLQPINSPPVVTKMDDPAGGIDLTLVFQSNGAFSFTFPFLTAVDLSAFSSYGLAVTKFNTDTLVSAQSFMTDANTTEITDPNGSSLVLVNDFNFDLDALFDNQGSTPFDPNSVKSFGFTIFGAQGTTANVHVSPLPEPTSIAIIIFGIAGSRMRRRSKHF